MYLFLLLQETLSRYITVGRRSRTPARRYSALSLPRSVSPTRSQSLSQSGGHSRNPSLRRGRESDMARRPLVVSFRRPRTNLPTTCIHAARCTCRISYAPKQDHPPIEETSLNIREANSYNAPTKVKIFKKWGKKKPTVNANISCKVICSECHRYLNNEPDAQSKLSTTNENSVSSTNEEYKSKTSAESEKLNMRMLSNIPMSETDLIPHHRCPNQHNSHVFTKSQNIPNGLAVDGHYSVPHSKTMPDIVKYALQISDKLETPKQDAEVVAKVKPIDDDNQPINRDKSNNKKNQEEEEEEQNTEEIYATSLNETKTSTRKWGSVENLSMEIV